LEVTDDTVRFGAFVLAHCAAIAATNEPGDLICPFAIYEQAGQRQVVNFEAESQDAAVTAGWEHFEQAKASADYWALGREGYFTFPDGRSDVLVVSVWKRGMEQPMALLHRFTPTSEGPFKLRGPTEANIGESLFTQPEHPFLTKAVTEGIANHPKGGQWDSWRVRDA
jgi:hypothetical protein